MRTQGTIVTGSNTPDPSDGFAPPTPEEKRQTDVLYNGQAGGFGAPDKGQMYGTPLLAGAIVNRFDDYARHTGAAWSEREQILDEFKTIQQQTGLEEPLMAIILEAKMNNRIADVQLTDDPEADEHADAKRIQEWTVETRTILNQTYGAKEAEQLIARTNRFVKRFPALAKILQQRGLGSRPDVVLGLVHHVFSEGIQ